jgi:Zn-dependent protease with chaperone function/Zn-finger nucleic acid-binding protein
MQALTQETVFEARRKARRASFFLFCLLAGMYLAFFNVLAWLWGYRTWLWHPRPHPFEPLAFLAVSAAAVLVALFHYFSASQKPLEEVLARLGARPADPDDSVHQVFANLVSEAEAACGVRPIQPVVLAESGLNAWSLQDGQGHCALGVTEGLLARLNRQELGAVVAHEAAHLAQRDSRLNTQACALLGGFDALVRWLQPDYDNVRGAATPPSAALWLVAAMMRGMARLVYTALSREREYLADAQAVRMCGGALDLAGALHELLYRPRSVAGVAGMGAIFIADPEDSSFENGEGVLSGLFSTHPPLSRRMERLLAWGKVDPGEFEKSMAAKPQVHLESRTAVREGGLDLKCGHCGIGLESWRVEGALLARCPSCHGSLLKPGVLERLLTRDWIRYSGADLEKAKAWQASQAGKAYGSGLEGACPPCPSCSHEMKKTMHSLYTRTIVERCVSCHSLWCPAGALELMHALAQQE